MNKEEELQKVGELFPLKNSWTIWHSGTAEHETYASICNIDNWRNTLKYIQTLKSTADYIMYINWIIRDCNRPLYLCAHNIFMEGFVPIREPITGICFIEYDLFDLSSNEYKIVLSYMLGGTCPTIIGVSLFNNRISYKVRVYVTTEDVDEFKKIYEKINTSINLRGNIWYYDDSELSLNSEPPLSPPH